MFVTDTDILVRDLDLVTLCRLDIGGVDIYVVRMAKAKCWRKDRLTASEGYLAYVCVCVRVVWRDP